MTATPLSITGPASLIAAVPYLLGFEPTDSLVLIGMRDGQVSVSARLDLDDLDRPNAVADVMAVLAVRAECTEVVAVTYGQRTEPELITSNAAANGLQLREHLRVSDGRYWLLTCPIEQCCPADGTPIPTDHAVAAEFVGHGAGKAPSREDLEAILTPVSDTDRLVPLLQDAAQDTVNHTLAGRGKSHTTSAKRALFAATRREDRRWSDDETARHAEALTSMEIRDAVWLAIDNGRLDGRDLFLHLARNLPQTHRAPALFLFAWKTWRAGNGALASMAVERALQADPHYTAAHLLTNALTTGVNPQQMPRLQLAS
jgi:hypothetical protein